MDTAPARVAFTDGLGDRHLTNGLDNEPLEVLTLRKEFASVAGFEFALRERVSRLAGFHDQCFGTVRGVSRLGSDATSLALVSDRVKGDRLSEILRVAERELLPLEIGAGLALIRQLVDAVAVLHEAFIDVCHGAIAPERIVITKDDRLVLVEHVLGGALSSLQYSRDRYWKELRVALPTTAGAPHFDRRADVTQVGAIALALIAGRPLADADYPDKVSEIVSRVGAVSASGGLAPLPGVFRAWLSRALQLDPRASFASAIEARDEFERVLTETGLTASPEKLTAFLNQCRATARGPVAAAPARVAFPAAAPVVTRRPPSSTTHAIPRPAVAAPRPIQAPRTVAVPAVPVPAPARSPRRRQIVAAALAAAIGSMGTLTARTFLVDSAFADVPTATPVASRRPTHASVRPSTNHAISTAAATANPIATEPAATSTDTVTPPAETDTAPRTGWISIVAPENVELYENGQHLGNSRTRRIPLAAGRHDINVVNRSLGYKTQQVVTVSEGKVSTVTPEWPNGLLSVNALPWADVFVNGERLGETPIGNVTLPIGFYEVVFRHPELGETKHRVTLTATSPTRLSVDLRNQ
jgi:hypothetical protein